MDFIIGILAIITQFISSVLHWADTHGEWVAIFFAWWYFNDQFDRVNQRLISLEQIIREVQNN